MAANITRLKILWFSSNDENTDVDSRVTCNKYILNISLTYKYVVYNIT